MPELPEVEVLRQAIHPRIVDKTVTDVRIVAPNLLLYPSKVEFINLILNRKIIDTDRRGKLLIIRLEGKYNLVFHFKLTGSLSLCNTCDETPYAYMILTLGDIALCYTDQRLLGNAWLVHDEDIALTGITNLGPEAIKPYMKLPYVYNYLHSTIHPIKQVLMEQQFLAGIGNYYSDEILFQAGINPEQPSNSLSEEDTELLYNTIDDILQQAITSLSVNIDSVSLGYSNPFESNRAPLVYGRKFKRCIKCGSTIEGVKIAGRNGCYCPNCQKYKRGIHDFIV